VYKGYEEEAFFHYYKQTQVKVLECTSEPAVMLHEILDQSLKAKERTPERIQSTIRKGHTTFLEFITIGFEIQNISKSCLMQLRTHRHASYMSSSHHYSICKDAFVAPFICSTDSTSFLRDRVRDHLKASHDLYEDLLTAGVRREEARNCLPGAIAYDITVQFNARSLLTFFRQRLCKRNIAELAALATKMLVICNNWCPSVFELAGPACLSKDGACDQGNQTCGSALCL
jgi:thymidylate synthase (FAD)